MLIWSVGSRSSPHSWQMYTSWLFLCCQIHQYWEAPLLVQIVNLRHLLSKKLSPLVSPSFSFLSSYCMAPLTCKCCLSNCINFINTLFHHLFTPKDKCRCRVELTWHILLQQISLFFLYKLDSTCSHDNELTPGLIFLRYLTYATGACYDWAT